MITDEELQKIRERATQATAGPLSCGQLPREEEVDTWLLGDGGQLWCRIVGGPDRSACHDAVFFSYARTDVLKLLDEIARMRSEIERLNDEIEENRQHALTVIRKTPIDQYQPPEFVIAKLRIDMERNL